MRRDDVADDADDSDTDHRSSLNADLTLFNLESIRGFTQTKLQVAGAKIRFEDARADLILRVADRYFQVLAAGDNREVAGRQKTAIQRQMDFASDRLTVGLGTRTDLFDAQARFQQAVADVIAADNRIDNAVQALKEITGNMTGDMPDGTPGDLATLSENAPLEPPEPASLEVWIETIRVREAVSNFFNSEAWLDVKTSFVKIYIDFRHEGWEGARRRFINLADVTGEDGALRTLDLEEGASMQDVKTQYQILVKKWHPDHNQGAGESEKEYAQQRFMEIQKAYETLRRLYGRTKWSNL